MKKILVLAFLAIACSFTIASVCLANQQKKLPDAAIENNVDNIPHPELGEDYLENDFDTPQIEDYAKEWYEYVEFNMENPTIVTEKTFIANFFMPVDTDIASVMEISGLTMSTKSEAGNIAGQTQTIHGLDQYTTASSITVEYTIENSFSLGFEESITSETTFGILIEETISLGFTSSQQMTTSKGQTYSRTFEAIPEENGTIIPWQVVQYDVKLPVYTRLYTKDYRLYDEGYILLNLMSGVCRRWANGYIEHWRTGEKVTIDDFMGEYLSPQNLIMSILQNGIF